MQTQTQTDEKESPFHLTINGVPKCQAQKVITERQKELAQKYCAQIGKKFVCHYYIETDEQRRQIINAVVAAMPGKKIALVPGYHQRS